jgi:hypothetical protein
VESGCDDKTRFEQKTRETRTAVIGIMLFLAISVKFEEALVYYSIAWR